jgi:hypothetical protein
MNNLLLQAARYALGVCWNFLDSRFVAHNDPRRPLSAALPISKRMSSWLLQYVVHDLDDLGVSQNPFFRKPPDVDAISTFDVHKHFGPPPMAASADGCTTCWTSFVLFFLALCLETLS